MIFQIKKILNPNNNNNTENKLNLFITCLPSIGQINSIL